MNNVELTDINKVVTDAKADRRKGDYRVYSQYKQRLEYICTSSVEYEKACKKIAEALRV